MSAFKGKNIIVLGASSGIGAALAEFYASEGAFVGLYARREDRLAQVAEKCQGRAMYQRCDSTNYEEVAQIAKDFVAKKGKIHVWVNCVGQNKAIGKTWEIKPEHLWEEVSVDLQSCIHGTHVALQYFVPENQGIILNFCGGGTIHPHLYASAYSSAKTAIARFTESVYLELKEDELDVEIYATNPGLVRNERTELLCTDPHSRKYMPDIEQVFNRGGGQPATLTGKLLELALEGKLKPWNGRLVLPFDLDQYKNPPQDVEGFLRLAGK